MTTDETVGTNVHALMWQRRVKRPAMCAALGISTSALSKKMRGEVAWSARDVAVAAAVLSVDPGRLYRSGEVLPQKDSNFQPAGYQMGLAA